MGKEQCFSDDPQGVSRAKNEGGTKQASEKAGAKKRKQQRRGEISKELDIFRSQEAITLKHPTEPASPENLSQEPDRTSPSHPASAKDDLPDEQGGFIFRGVLPIREPSPPKRKPSYKRRLGRQGGNDHSPEPNKPSSAR